MIKQSKYEGAHAAECRRRLSHLRSSSSDDQCHQTPTPATTGQGKEHSERQPGPHDREDRGLQRPGEPTGHESRIVVLAERGTNPTLSCDDLDGTDRRRNRRRRKDRSADRRIDPSGRTGRRDRSAVSSRQRRRRGTVGTALCQPATPVLSSAMANLNGGVVANGVAGGDEPPHQVNVFTKAQRRVESSNLIERSYPNSEGG